MAEAQIKMVIHLFIWIGQMLEAAKTIEAFL